MDERAANFQRYSLVQDLEPNDYYEEPNFARDCHFRNDWNGYNVPLSRNGSPPPQFGFDPRHLRPEHPPYQNLIDTDHHYPGSNLIKTCLPPEGIPANDYDQEDSQMNKGHSERFLLRPLPNRLYRRPPPERAFPRGSGAPPRRKPPPCKFCGNSSKQPGSCPCPCPLHLPAVHSRYMRVFQDHARNSMTIHVFRNGDYRATPTMIHFSRLHIQSMEDVMKLIDRHIRFPVGYAYALYNLWGELVEDPMELEPNENYVVVNNCKKQFLQMDYGSKKPSVIYTRRKRGKFPQASFTLSFSTFKED